MGFPIFYNGKILFRNGKPAFSVDCCCDDVQTCDCDGIQLPTALNARVYGTGKGAAIACESVMNWSPIQACWNTPQGLAGLAGQIQCGCAYFNLQLCCSQGGDTLADRYILSILNSSCEFLVPNPQGANGNSTCSPIHLEFGPFEIQDFTDTTCIPCPGDTGEIWVEITG